MAEILYQGTCGEHLTWTFDTDGLLTVSGTGPMENYDLSVPGWRGGNYASVPSVRDAILSVVIEEGVTTVGNYAFDLSRGLVSVTIPNSVAAIGKYGFSGCPALTSLTIGSGVTDIANSAFEDCDALQDIYYAGTAQQWAAVQIAARNEPLSAASLHPAAPSGGDTPASTHAIEYAARPEEPVPLGHQGENLARRIVFDIAPWEAAYGDGEVRLLHQRRLDTIPYPVPVLRETGRVLWDVRAVDTAQAGRYGKAELRYYVNDILVKSDIYRTGVLPSLAAPSVSAPEEPPAWFESALDAASQAVQAVETVQAAVQDAAVQDESHAAALRTAAAEAVSDLTDILETARADAQNILNLADSGAESLLESVRDSAQQAAQSAQNAETARQSIAGLETEAVTLEPRASASVASSTQNSHIKLTFGIPQGAKGDTGPAGNDATINGVNALTIEQGTNITLSQSGSALTISAQDTTYAPATTSADGLMSASDKQELARLRQLVNGIDASIYLSAGPGNPVSVSDAYADAPLRAFTVDLPVIQAGSGAPSPDNVRPISGYTGVTVRRYGQNEEDNPLSVPFSFDSVDVTGQNEPGVVYGGTLDVLTGTLTVSWKTRDLTSLSWGTAVHNNPQGIANGYQHSANLGGFHPVSDQNMMLWSHYKNSTTGFTGVPDLCARKPNQNYFIIRDDRFDNNDDWLAYVRAQSDAGTPLQLSVPLATPLTFQLSPAQIAALPGVNTFSATAGDVSVTYRMDPTLAYENLTNAILSLGMGI